MIRKEGIKNISLTFSEIEMLKYSVNVTITERYSDLYTKLYEALL